MNDIDINFDPAKSKIVPSEIIITNEIDEKVLRKLVKIKFIKIGI